MNRTLALGIAAALALCAGTGTTLGQAGTAFTYQGQLKNAGSVVTTPTDMQFSLWTAASGGSQVGSTVTQNAVTVSSGLFNTQVDFGVNPYASDQGLWLQIAVRNPAGSGSFVPMGARQKLTPAPFSMATRGMAIDGANNASFSGRGSFGDVSGFSNHMLSSRVGAVQGVDVAIFGSHQGTSGFNAGVYGRTQSPNGYGVFSEGNFQTSGNAFVLGNVGIGTTSPERALHLKGDSVGMFFQDTGDADGPNARWGWDTRAFGVNGIALTRYDGTSANAQRSLFMNNNGNLGVGLGAPFNKIDVQVGGTIGNSTIFGPQYNDPANRGTKVGFGYRTPGDGCGPDNFRGMRVEVVAGSSCGNSSDLTFWTDACNFSCPREVMRINGEGNVGIGTATPDFFYRLDVAGSIKCVGLTQTSSREFKTDIVPLTGALDSIMKLNPVTYAWNEKAPEQVQGHRDIGFIADEMDKVLPDIVAKDASGKPIGIDYTKITPVAVEAIKQLKAENDAKQARIDELAARLERLEVLLGQNK